jgi:hypothetical protein
MYSCAVCTYLLPESLFVLEHGHLHEPHVAVTIQELLHLHHHPSSLSERTSRVKRCLVVLFAFFTTSY